MDINSTIKLKVQELIHGRGMTVYELADKVNRSYSYLCRIASPTEELPTPLEIILPAMKLKKNYHLLEYMAWSCGFALVRLPKVAANKKDETELAAEYQTAVSDAVNALLKFFDNPTKQTYENVKQALIDATQQELTIKKYCEKKMRNQLELEL